MTSSNGNIFRVTGHWCGIYTGPGEFPAQRPVTRSFDVFFDLRLNKRLSKQSWGWWFETKSRPLWRQCNVYDFTGKPTRCFFGTLKLVNPWFKIIKSRVESVFSHAFDKDDLVSTKYKNTLYIPFSSLLKIHHSENAFGLICHPIELWVICIGCYVLWKAKNVSLLEKMILVNTWSTNEQNDIGM